MSSSSDTRFLVIDVGTTGLRAAIVDDDLNIVNFEHRANPPSIPFDGPVEFEASRAVIAAADAPVAGVGITNAYEHDRVGPGHRRTDRARCARTGPKLASRPLGARLLMRPREHPALHERANPMFTGHAALESQRMPSEEGRSRMTPKGPIPRGSRNR